MESESVIDYLNLSGLYPEWDEFSLLVCDICGTIIRPQAFEKHLKTKHHIGVQTASNSPVTTAGITMNDSSINNKLQHQKQQQISLPKQQLDQSQHQQPNQLHAQQPQAQKITINPPPIALDRKPIITARTVVTAVPNIKPTTITTTPAIKTTSNSINKLANGTTNHVLVSSKPVKRSAPSANISITTTKQTNSLSAGVDAPTSAKTKPKIKTKAAHANSKAQRPIAETNGRGSKNTIAPATPTAPVASQPSLPSALGTAASTLLQTPDGFFDPSFYGLEPLSPPTSTIGGPLSSSSSASSTISSASSSSSTSSSGSSTNSSLSYCTSLSNHNHHRNVISLPLNGSPNHLPPPIVLSKYQDRKWRNTYNVLRDAFF